MKLLNSKLSLCLCPHPDDVEYAMGGTIEKYKETSFHVLYLSRGGAWDSTKGQERLNESQAFWGFGKNVMMRDPGADFVGMSEDAAILNLENNTAINLDLYDTIFIPTAKDTHFFHRAVNSIGQALCRVRKINLIEYACPSVKPTWIPNLVVDIGDHYESKKEKLKAFESQNHHSYFKDICLDAYHSDLHYNKKGMGWIERFKIINIYG